MDEEWSRRIAGLCIAARADTSQVGSCIEVGRERARAATCQPPHGGPARPLLGDLALFPGRAVGVQGLLDGSPAGLAQHPAQWSTTRPTGPGSPGRFSLLRCGLPRPGTRAGSGVEPPLPRVPALTVTLPGSHVGSDSDGPPSRPIPSPSVQAGPGSTPYLGAGPGYCCGLPDCDGRRHGSNARPHDLAAQPSCLPSAGVNALEPSAFARRAPLA